MPEFTGAAEDLAAIVKILKEEFPNEAAEILKTIVRIEY